jgi:hypothetical protein
MLLLLTIGPSPARTGLTGHSQEIAMNVRTIIKRWILCCAVGLGLLSATGAQEVWERLTDYEKPKNGEEQRAWDLIKACRHQGSEGARRLIAEMQRIPHKYRRNALGALSRIQSQETRDYLLSLALASSDTYAAIVYLENSGDDSPARKLLNSTNREIQVIAFHGLLSGHMKGLSQRRQDYSIPFDRRTWDVTKDMLASESLEHRRLATMIVRKASDNEVPTEEKAKALALSMLTTLAMPEAQNESAYDGPGWYYNFPLGEDVLAEQALALGGMKRVPKDLLSALTPAEPGRVREAILIARALVGDSTVRGEIHQIATNSPSGRLRMAAVGKVLHSQAVIEADRECLERVAAADPLQGRPGNNYAYITGDHCPEDVRNAIVYPVRILARRSLAALDARKNQPVSGP